MKFLVPFTKYHGLGNDFVIIDARDLARDASSLGLLKDWSTVVEHLSRYLCSRNYGVGADGLILALPMDENSYESLDVSALSKPVRGRKLTADFPKRHQRELSQSSVGQFLKEVKEAIGVITRQYKSPEDCLVAWVYRNSDGSSADMCGNGLRALSLWTINNMEPKESTFRIATKNGPVACRVKSDCGSISVDIGSPGLASDQIPVKVDKKVERIVKKTLTLKSGVSLPLTCVSMGNPHAVIYEGYGDEVASAYKKIRATNILEMGDRFFPENLAKLAVEIQAHEFFPEGVNVEFVNQVDKNHVEVLVYERGCGPTHACASGAASTLVAGVLEERLERSAKVSLPGGNLEIAWDETSGHVTIEGAAREVFSGVVWIDMSELMSNSGVNPDQKETSFS